MEKQIILSEQEYDSLLMYKKIAEDSNGFVYLLKHINTLGQHKEVWHIYSKEDFDLKLQIELDDLSKLRKSEELRRLDCREHESKKESVVQAYWRKIAFLFIVLFICVLFCLFMPKN